jgi:hypothetical protein
MALPAANNNMETGPALTNLSIPSTFQGQGKALNGIYSRIISATH